MDTGVYDGGEISMFYDSMIAKLIVHAATREQAIERMRDALNSFVIRGISSNIPFQSALMQHPRFQAGNFTTAFIAEEYPKGFDASDVPHDDPALLIGVAAFVHRTYIDRAARVTGQLPGHELKVGDEWVVLRDGVPHSVTVEAAEGGYDVTYSGETFKLRSDWKLGEALFEGTVNGEPFTMQLERRKLAYRLFHWGTQVDLTVLRARAAELLSLMPEKQAPDMSKFLL